MNVLKSLRLILSKSALAMAAAAVLFGGPATAQTAIKFSLDFKFEGPAAPRLTGVFAVQDRLSLSGERAAAGLGCIGSTSGSSRIVNPASLGDAASRYHRWQPEQVPRNWSGCCKFGWWISRAERQPRHSRDSKVPGSTR